MKKTKIIYIVSTLNKLGPVRVLSDIISNLDFKNFDAEIITFKSYDDNDLSLQLHKLVKITKVDGNFIQKIWKIRKIISLSMASIVHSHGLEADLFNLLCGGKDVVKINTIHAFIIEDYKLSFGRYKGYLLGVLHMFLTRFLDKPIACSASVANYYQDTCGLSIDYVRNGVDKQQIELEAEYSFLSGKIVYCYTGKVTNRKNVEFIINAFVNSKVDAYLLIVGDGDLFDFLKRKYIDNSSIIFTGFINLPLKLVQYGAYYISASLFEGMSMSILEAMSLGKPVMLSDIPSHREIFELDSNKPVGYLFRTQSDLVNLFNITSNLSKNEYDNLSANVNDCYERYLTGKRMSYEYQKYYSEFKKYR